jgi:hypothetical protein
MPAQGISIDYVKDATAVIFLVTDVRAPGRMRRRKATYGDIYCKTLKNKHSRYQSPQQAPHGKEIYLRHDQLIPLKGRSESRWFVFTFVNSLPLSRAAFGAILPSAVFYER